MESSGKCGLKLSNDPNFIDKLHDVGRAPCRPARASVVLSVDEKSRIQALDRTQPGLQMKKGRAGTMTHDYRRNGTTTLFTALNMDGLAGRRPSLDRVEEADELLMTVALPSTRLASSLRVEQF